MTLKGLFWSKGYGYYPTDKDTHHNYLTIYGELLGKWENEAINILEVGTWKGGSMKLLEEYFVNANIIGYDIIAPEVPLSRAKVTVKDFYSIDTNELPELTIAIDDGDHSVGSQLKFVQMVYPKMAKGGILIVEDVRPEFKQHFDTLGIPYSAMAFYPYTDENDDRIIVFRK
jgi:hypothetical protein